MPSLTDSSMLSPKVTKKHDSDLSVSSNNVMQAKAGKFHSKKIVFTQEAEQKTDSRKKVLAKIQR